MLQHAIYQVAFNSPFQEGTAPFIDPNYPGAARSSQPIWPNRALMGLSAGKVLIAQR